MKNTTTEENVEQVNPKWAEQFEAGLYRMFAQMEKRFASQPAPTIPDRTFDPTRLTTEEEQAEYDMAMNQVFVKLNPSTKKPDGTQDRYRVSHVYPEYQNSNSAEFVAKFSVEKYQEAKGPEGTLVKTKIDAFNIPARDFILNYRPLNVPVV